MADNLADNSAAQTDGLKDALRAVHSAFRSVDHSAHSTVALSEEPTAACLVLLSVFHLADCSVDGLVEC